MTTSLSNLPFPDNEFNVAYSAAVLEHLTEPEKMLREGIRVLKSGGHLVLMCPNYGSPNRASPVFTGSRFKKFASGVIDDFTRGNARATTLKWKRVIPLEDPKKYEMDLDTTEEPYIGTLTPFLSAHGMHIIKWSTCWEEELPGAKIHQKLFRMLSGIGIYPFTQWGPHLVVVAVKNKC